MEIKKRIALFGASGQDGSNLIDYLLTQNCEIYCLVRRHSVAENQQYRLEHVKHLIQCEYGDLTDKISVNRFITNAKPDYIIQLGAMSHVRISFDMPEFTMNTNFIGNQNVLEAYRTICPEAKYYFAGSSEAFGLNVDPDMYQRETTPFNPTSPYGISKVASINMVHHYRRAYNLHACVGILFNHSGLRRGSNFVEQKVCKQAVEIKLGLRKNIELGNLDTYRDFGASVDYVKAMWKIVNHDVADDFVIATGIATSIREMCDVVFKYLGMDYNYYVIQNPAFMRSEELPYLRGDATKAKTILGWTPTYTFEKMIHEMVDYWMVELQKK